MITSHILKIPSNMQLFNIFYSFCHTQLHLGSSAKLKIWQVSDWKMEHKVALFSNLEHTQLSFSFNVWCLKPNCPPPHSQYMFLPHPSCIPESMCPPFLAYIFSLRSLPPQCISVLLPHLALSGIQREVSINKD